MTKIKKKPRAQNAQVVNVDQILEILSKSVYTDVRSLYQDYCVLVGEEVSPKLFASKIRELDKEGKVDLLGPLVEVHSLLEYLKNLDESLWFYLAIIIAILTFIFALYDNNYPWEIARWVFGSIEVAFSVGYVTLKAIFPGKEDFDSIEMTALAVAVSVSVSGLIGLLVDITPFGLRELPVLTALTVYTLVATATALYTNYSWRRKNIAAQPKKKEEQAIFHD